MTLNGRGTAFWLKMAGTDDWAGRPANRTQAPDSRRQRTAFCATVLLVACAQAPRLDAPQVSRSTRETWSCATRHKQGRMPCQFVYFNFDRERIEERWFAAARGIAGAQIKYSWRSLEPQRGRYDFSAVEHDLAVLRAQGRLLFVQVQDVSFDSSIVNVPKYLLTDTAFHGGVARQVEHGEDPATARARGWVARRWDPAVQARFDRLLDTLGRALDGQIEGINLAETAVDMPRSGPLVPDGYTPSRYRNATLSTMSALRRSFPRSTAMLYANFMPGETTDSTPDFLRSVYAHATEIGLAMGGPDLLPNKFFQMNHSYGMLHRIGNSVPVGIAVQDGNYAHVDPTTKRRVTVAEQVAFAACYLGASYIFWQVEEPAFSQNVLPYLAKTTKPPC